MSSLVNNVGDPKKPWEDVPVEVLIEEERKKQEEWERNRPRIQLPIPEHYPAYDPKKDQNREEIGEEDCKIVIPLI
jgi:hypothetical protein